MQFNLSTGKVTHATKTLFHKWSCDEVFKIYEHVQDVTKICSERKDQALMMHFFGDMRFSQHLSYFEPQDWIDLIKSFRLQRFYPGQRIYTNQDRLDSFHIILQGSVGIFYPDHQLLKQFQDSF